MYILGFSNLYLSCTQAHSFDLNPPMGWFSEPSEKSVKNLVNDTNLRLAGLLQPHQRIGEEGASREAATPEEAQDEAAFPEEARYGEPVFEEPAYFGSVPNCPLD